METLNQNSNRIFCALIDKMQDKQHLKIVNEPFMPLTIERIGEAYGGEAKLYSLCHYYEQNGDLMQDPEMCFIVADNREKETVMWDQVRITPYLYQQANLGIYQASIIFENNELATIYHDLQAEHTQFANQWLTNIEQQGFLKRTGQQ
jgi:hypothetical protein